MAARDLVLFGEGFSPWTVKARWALDHHRISYRYSEYTPLLSEPSLRIRAGRIRGSVSVPYLVGDGLSIGDSFAIACEADRIGEGTRVLAGEVTGGAPLVPADLLDAIKTWNDLADRLMRAGRAQILARTEEQTEVQLESLPQNFPRAIRRVLAPTVKVGTAYLRKKYDVREISDEELEKDLAVIRTAISKDESAPLLGRFSLADIAVACALQAVRPHRTEPRGLLPAQREGWARPALAARWEDVLSWRDAMFARRPSS